MKLKELVENMICIEIELMCYEKKFGIKSSDFYQAITKGELDEFDAQDEYRMEFIEWLALCRTWFSLNVNYRQIISRQPVGVQIKSALAA